MTEREAAAWLDEAAVLVEPSPEYDEWLRRGPSVVRALRAALAAPSRDAGLREALADARRLAYPFSLSPVQREKIVRRIDAALASPADQSEAE